MNLTEFATSVAIKVNKEEDFGYIESLKFDILGYRASIIASMSNRELSEIYYQSLYSFNDIKDYIEIPPLLPFKDGTFKINAVVKLNNKFRLISIITEESASFIEGKRFSKGLPHLVISGNKLYPVNFEPSTIKDLKINGIFNNPLESLNLNTCSVNSKCIENNDLIIEDSLYQKIVIFLYKQLGLENNNEILNNNK